MRVMYLNPKKDEVLANNKDSKNSDECRIRRYHYLVCQVSFAGTQPFGGARKGTSPGQR